jgi:hypothetical protein
MRLLAAALLSASALSAQAPGAIWPVARPAEVGLNAAVLDSIDAEIKAGQYGYIDRFLVIRQGKVAFDAAY